jgi:hypothetical protein
MARQNGRIIHWLGEIWFRGLIALGHFFTMASDGKSIAYHLFALWTTVCVVEKFKFAFAIIGVTFYADDCLQHH